jgi:formylglycine-generating enzyme
MQDYNEGDLLKDTEGKPLKLFGIDYTELVYVAPSSFIIGDSEKEISFAKGYFIGKYTVTQALYEAVMVMGENPSRFKGKYRPVEQVSHDDICQKGGFLEKLYAKIKAEYSSLEGLFALPSEAQWEYAARGGQYWNHPKLDYAGSQNLNDVGWYDENSNSQTMPVGLKQPNALGLYDMSGNVWEWCADWFEDDYSKILNDGSPNTTKGIFRVLRGGSYFYDDGHCHVAFRYGYHPDDRDRLTGFRLVFPQFNR